MPYANIQFSLEDDLAVITLDRAQRRNALSLQMMQELLSALDDIGNRQAVRAVILRAEGPAFCAGHDLTELHSLALADYRQLFDVCSQLMTRIQTIPQPVIAEIHGIATAAGCQLVASCDLAIASEEAKFATPGVKIGLFCTTPMVALTRAIGRKRAMQMLLTGEAISARTAAEWGLINSVVPPAELRQATRSLAARIAESSSYTTAIGKQAFYAQIELDQGSAYAYASEIMTMNSLAADANEGITAFLEKRPPCWTGA